MTLTLSEWHEVKVDEDLCVGPALNSTRVRFLIKSQFVNRCNADNVCCEVGYATLEG